jgi:hypothetical protein
MTEKRNASSDKLNLDDEKLNLIFKMALCAAPGRPIANVIESMVQKGLRKALEIHRRDMEAVHARIALIEAALLDLKKGQ